MRIRLYFVYLMSNASRTLYVGVTNNLFLRVWQHKKGLFAGFTRKYHLTHLVYYETYRNVEMAIAREKQMKGWRRSKKVALIAGKNPPWMDLASELDRPAVSRFQKPGARERRSLVGGLRPPPRDDKSLCHL